MAAARSEALLKADEAVGRNPYDVEAWRFILAEAAVCPQARAVGLLGAMPLFEWCVMCV